MDRFVGLDLEQIADPVTRRNFRVIERALIRLTVGDNPLGSGTTVQNIGGGGGSVSCDFPTIHENEYFSNAREGFGVFGRGAEDNLAHGMAVNSKGEPQIAELPGTLVSASAANNSKPFAYSFASQIFTIPRGKRSHYGTSPTNFSQLNMGQFDDFNIGVAEGAGDVTADCGVLTMDSPKCVARIFNELDGNLEGANQAISMTSGTHDSGASLGVNRFRKGCISFKTGVNGTPPGTVRIFLVARPTSTSAAEVVQKFWEFDADSWINGISNGLVLYFDVITPYIAISVVATGSPDGSNNYQVGPNTFYVNLYS